MSQYSSNFPQYQSKYNKQYAGTESQILSEINNYQNPILSSAELKFDQNDMVIKPAVYSEAKYIKEKDTYETLKPITKQVVQLPTKTKQKVKTTKTVYNKEIILSEKDDLNQFLQNNQFFEQEIDVPIPTKSTIANLCKESVIASSSSNYYPSQQQSSKYKSKISENDIFSKQEYETKIIENVMNDNQPIASKVIKVSNTSKHQSEVNYPTQNSKMQSMKYQSANINNMNKDYQISKVEQFPSTYTTAGKEYPGTKVTKISSHHVNTDLNNQNQINLKVPNIHKDYHQSKIQMSKIPYRNLKQSDNEGGFIEISDVSNPTNINKNNNNINYNNISNKNYIETYFHDDDIPKPEVFEGVGLENSNIKPNIKNTNILEQPPEEQKLNESSSYKNSKNRQSQKYSYINQSNNINNRSKEQNIINSKINNSIEQNNISKKSMQQNNLNSKVNNSIEQNNINNKSVKKIDSKDAQQTKSLLEELPVDQTQIMSHQPSIDMSQMKNSTLFKQSVHQSTIDSNPVQDSKIQRQSKAYQQQSNIPSIVQKSSSNHSKKDNSQINSQIQRSNMTYQQPYNRYNQSKNMQNPQTYYSQHIQNNQNINQKSYKLSNNIDVSTHKSNANQMASNQLPVSQMKKLDNQSNIYQNSIKQSGVNNINNENNIVQSQMNQSKNSKMGSFMLSQHSSRLEQSNDLISSSNNNNNKSKIKGIDNYEVTPNKSNVSQKNSKMNFKGDRSSFPTPSYAGNINPKEQVPPNPFEGENNSIKGSNLKMLEDKLRDSEMK